MPPTVTPIVVVGAGIAGLSAARLLHEAGQEVVVLDKGRGVGGRMATRRSGEACFDHGAQFFTVRDPAFARRVAQWVAEGTAVPWGQGFAYGRGGPGEDGHTRYRGRAGMTSIPKRLAQGLDVRLGTRVTAVRAEGQCWELAMEGQVAPLRARALIMTPPAPQTLALLAAGQTRLPALLHEALESIHFAPCLALLVRLDGPSRVPAPGGLQLMDEPIFWIGDNQQKGISPAASAVTIHAGPAFSAANWDADAEGIAGHLLRAAEPWLGTAVAAWQLHRWRYSLPLTPLPERMLVWPGAAPLIFAGDAFGGPRVEGAALSGHAAASALRDLLHDQRT